MICMRKHKVTVCAHECITTAYVAVHSLQHVEVRGEEDIAFSLFDQVDAHVNCHSILQNASNNKITTKKQNKKEKSMQKHAFRIFFCFCFVI